MREHDGFKHFLVGDFLGTGFDHDDLLFGACDGELQGAAFALLGSRVDDETFFLGETHKYAADRTVPRNIGDGEGDGCADHTSDLGGAVMIHGGDEQGDRHVVAQILRKKRTDGTVDDAGGQNRLFTWSAFSLEIRAGDSADGVQSFLKIDGQRQKIDAVARAFGGGGAGKDRGIAIADENGAVCQTCHFAGFDHEGTTGQVVAECSEILKHIGE